MSEYTETKDTGVTGLGGTDKAKWVSVKASHAESKPIDMLADPERHTAVLAYLLDRFKLSENAMSKFYARWRVNERKHQAYIDLPDWEKLLKEMNDAGKAPKAVNITVPYIFATTSSIVTYLLHTFAGRKPIFSVGSYAQKDPKAARMMETVLQFNTEHIRFIKHMYQFFMDSQIYGVSAFRCQWRVDKAMRTLWTEEKDMVGGIPTGQPGQRVRSRAEKVVYEGNEVATIDPFMFFPDPRVPMNEVNRRGEFVFWKSFEGQHILKKGEKAGRFKYVEKIKSSSSGQDDNGGNSGAGESNRGIRSGGEAHPGSYLDEQQRNTTMKPVEFIQGTVEIIPAELGLGEEEYPVKYIFAIGNRNRIIQCEPLGLDHDQHPVVVTEPYGVGYGFGQLGLADYQGPIQDLLSWFMNSHMDNVKTALNNMCIVDPSKIEMQDLKKPGAGKIIRLKAAAYGSDVRSAYTQLPIIDVTANHVKDFETVMRLGDALSSVTDNVRGLQAAGGRKTATEVRTSGEAAASRLAAQARIISAQAFVDLSEQMALNIQQNLTQEFYLRIVGSDQGAEPMQITPEMLTGDFHFPINDGTLPVDKVAMLDVWKELFVALRGDPVLAGKYDLAKIFEHVAELGGARNVEQFRLEVNSQEAMEQKAAAGNAVPLKDAPKGEGSPAAGVDPNPAERVGGI